MLPGQLEWGSLFQYCPSLMHPHHLAAVPLSLLSDGFLYGGPSSAGIDASHFNGDSFRVSAATTTAQASLSEPLIKTLGHWRSLSYSVYIWTPRQQLTSVCKTNCLNCCQSLLLFSATREHTKGEGGYAYNWYINGKEE